MNVAKNDFAQPLAASTSDKDGMYVYAAEAVQTRRKLPGGTILRKRIIWFKARHLQGEGRVAAQRAEFNMITEKRMDLAKNHSGGVFLL